MFKQVFASLTIWPTVALVLFFIVLCGAIVWVHRPGVGLMYDEVAKLPLGDD